MHRTNTAPTEVLLSWSGGKDSALALHTLRGDDRYDVVGLLTCITRGFDRISIHGVRRSLLDAQAESIGLPLHVIELEQASSNEAYEAAFHAGLLAARRVHPNARHVAFGDLFLSDVRAYRERLLEPTDWTPTFPLWELDTTSLANRFVNDGFSARLVCVDTTQLDGGFAGRLFDHDMLADLPAGVDPCGERGEFHTFVANGPGFSRAIEYRVGDRVLRDQRFMYCDLLR